MVEDNSARDHRARRWPFTHEEKKWPDDAKKEKIKIGDTKSVSFKDDFNVLIGNETGEQFLIWWKHFETKVYNNNKLSWKEKNDVFLCLIKDDALIVVQQCFKEVTSNNPANYPNFKWETRFVQEYLRTLREENITNAQIARGEHDIRVAAFYEGKECVQVTVGTDDAATTQWRKGTTANGEVINQYMAYVYDKIFWRLSSQFFGSDMCGKKVYITMKQFIQNF